MRAGASVIITICWVIAFVVWVVMAFFTKRTVGRAGRGWVAWQLAALLVLVLVVRGATTIPLHRVLYTTPALDALAVVLVVAGLVLSLWARATLGRNWSGGVVVKEGHELVQAGPYAIVRHPIYTGLLTMCVGTALNYAEPYGFAVVGAIALGTWRKLRREERLMEGEFPEAYPDYRRRVKALIPYVL